ncbi:uncharacterized protein LOC123241456 [Gracilinanus agilis]|uniref:uncharacterized protein LOC123241456 n=1 Tax=Gracilinanus agilis TaxID=191870 RepID=UPI001CFEBFDD|nr:uncharacterized protein LOC123241456 [Gracilinanus agilis]
MTLLSSLLLLLVVGVTSVESVSSYSFHLHTCLYLLRHMTVVAESQDRNLTEKTTANILESPKYPMQKGSLNLLKQKWESNDGQKSECNVGGSRCRRFQPKDNKLLESGNAADASTGLSIAPKFISNLGEQKKDMESVCKIDTGLDGGQIEVIKEDMKGARRRIEHFSIALEELKSIFEAPRGAAGLAGGSKKVRHSIVICNRQVTN